MGRGSMTPVVVPRRCGAPCELSRGHTGKHWAAEPKPPRKAHGSEPMHGTIEDVRVLQATIRKAAMALVEEMGAEEQKHIGVTGRVEWGPPR
jgi:hypothetical protein